MNTNKGRERDQKCGGKGEIEKEKKREKERRERKKKKTGARRVKNRYNGRAGMWTVHSDNKKKGKRREVGGR